MFKKCTLITFSCNILQEDCYNCTIKNHKGETRNKTFKSNSIKICISDNRGMFDFAIHFMYMLDGQLIVRSALPSCLGSKW